MTAKFTLTAALPADLKGAPQMVLILKTLEKHGLNKPITTEELTKLVVADGLQTRQPPERIVGYYTKPIGELPYVTVEKTTAAPKAAKAAPAVAGADASAASGVAKPAKPAAPAPAPAAKSAEQAAAK